VRRTRKSGRRRRALGGVLSLAVVAAFLATPFWWHTRMHEITAIDELKERFNEDRGVTRLLLLLSRT
jgi:hypothetical protein